MAVLLSLLFAAAAAVVVVVVVVVAAASLTWLFSVMSYEPKLANSCSNSNCEPSEK